MFFFLHTALQSLIQINPVYLRILQRFLHVLHQRPHHVADLAVEVHLELAADIRRHQRFPETASVGGAREVFDFLLDSRLSPFTESNCQRVVHSTVATLTALASRCFRGS